MGIIRNGLSSVSVIKLVGMEHNSVPDSVITRHPVMVGEIASYSVPKRKPATATRSRARYMGTSANGLTFRAVAQHAGQALVLVIDIVQTLSLVMVEIIVRN